MPQDLASKYIQTAVHIPQRVLAKLLKASGAPESEAFCRKRLHDEIDACVDQVTPYEKVLQHHVRYVAVYGAKAAKPKLHSM